MQAQPTATILELGDEFYDPVAPADFPQTILRFRNDRAARQVGLDTLDDAAWLAHFGRFAPLPGSLAEPLALRYHGHQFGVYNPDIGDGRGFLHAQLRDDAGRLLDLGTKGTGRTPHSRSGDGRLTLKGAVREILASEMLEALGVPTSRTFSVVETGEALARGDEPSPTRSAALVRLSHGHIRIGTFQRLAYHRDADAMARLVGYVLVHLHGDAPGDPVRLLDTVVARTARLAARYMAAGFVHGVLNSDNISVTGESFDYGPWRFAPTWDPGFVAAYFDHAGRYAFGRQGDAIHWNAMQLAVALRTLADAEPLIAALDRFPALYADELAAALLWRLGRTPLDPGSDRTAAAALIAALHAAQAPLAHTFHAAFAADLPDTPDFAPARAALTNHPLRKDRDHPHWRGPACGMDIAEVEGIWHAIDAHDDWSPLHAKIADIRALGAALA